MTKFIQCRVKIKSVPHYFRLISTLRELGYKPMLLEDTLDELLVRRQMHSKRSVWLYAQDHGRYTIFANKSPVRYAMELTRKELKVRMEKIIKGCTCHPFAQVK